MLANLGIPWTIIGHFKRRALLNETSEFIGDRVAYTLSQGLNVIACVRETLKEREARKTTDLVNGVAGIEIDLGGNMYSNSDYMNVDDVGINLSKEDMNCDFHKEVKNSKECDGSPLMEMITEVAKNKVSVMGLGKVCSKVGATNELESHNFVKLSEQVDKDNKSALLHVSGDEDSGLEQKFSSDLGV
nr:triosephosphate isomerase, cytosolic-like [Tanacetum cinerariifolium]